MNFQKLDLDRWDRREYYHHFTQEVICTYSLTTDLDITPLETQRLYPAMLWLLTDTVNEFPEFRTQETSQGVGIFDTMHPSYTIFHRERKTFSSIWTEFSPDYREFLSRYEADVETYRNAGTFAPKLKKPENCFDVSMLPWLSFTGFNLNVHNGGRHLLPIFTLGKTRRQVGRTSLPLAIQAHHAVCDGYHTAAFLACLGEKIACFSANNP